MVGGWRYLWKDGGVGEWGLAAPACWWVCVRFLWCSCVPCRCCARWMVCRRGGGPVLGGMSCGRFSRLVEQEFEEVGLVRLGQGGCMLQGYVGAVCELLRCLGNGRPLHVRRHGPSLEYLCLLEDGGELPGCRGPRQPSGVLCDGVGEVPVCEGVQSSVQAAHLEVVPGFFFCVAADGFGVSCGDVHGAACVPSVVSGEEGKLFAAELELGFL